MKSRYRVAVDTGGTFTDLCLVDDATGRLSVAKVPSTPSDPSQAVIDGVAKLMSALDLRPEDVGFFLHGTTVATNALIERQGAATALITTHGFEDVLLIGRQNRPRLYDFRARRPEPIVPRRHCYGVHERTLHTGAIATSLNEGQVRTVAAEIKRHGITSIAVCLLHSYANPAHEQTIRALVQEVHPQAWVTISSDILPEYREYERTSTVCLNAYVMPKVTTYVKTLAERLQDQSLGSDLFIMQSNGGVITARTAQEESARTVLSGPAGGALTGVSLSRALRRPNLITIDIGGTSSDICLIQDGRPGFTTDSDIEGYPIKLPMIDIHTLGAGGGSIAWIDSGGALRVGPASAGASPGPACYGTGGEQPTVTDAQAILGRLNPGFLLDGRMPLNLELARDVIDHRIARPLGMDVERAAEGIITVVNANMIRGIRRVSVEKGYDPREFALVAFGGAGPLHGVELAAALNITQVIVPRYPGIASACGMLSADVRHDYVQTWLALAEGVEAGELDRRYLEMELGAVARLKREGFQDTAVEITRSIDMRYIGQSYELSIPVPAGAISGASVSSMIASYHLGHERAYGYARSHEPVELVNLRMVAIGKLPQEPNAQAGPAQTGGPRPVGYRPVRISGRTLNTPVLRRDDLRPGCSWTGAAVIEQLDSTTLVPPGCRATSEPQGNILIDLVGG